MPVDVRVIDTKTGKPVTDLGQQDFTVFENGVRQEIRLFALQRFDGDREEPAPAAVAQPAPGAPAAKTSGPLAFTPQTSRVFLFVLGTGRLQEPSKGLDATLEFVRTPPQADATWWRCSPTTARPPSRRSTSAWRGSSSGTGRRTT